jgi:hypothetical protein
MARVMLWNRHDHPEGGPMNRSPRYPAAAQRLAVNTGTIAVVAAFAALAVVVIVAGKVLPIGRL